MSTLLAGDRVLTGRHDLGPGWVEVAEGRIVDVGAGPPRRPADEVVAGCLAPGYVDMHCHGGGGASLTTGNPDDAARVALAHRRCGTTSLVASMVSDHVPALEQWLAELAGPVRDGILAGLHLEGPWLSSTFCGAHDPALLQDPRREDVDRLLAAGDGVLRMVTLAPELPGAVEAVRRVAAAGVVAAVGHTDASYDETLAAVGAGARVATHLFNGMRGLHHRRPGPVAALLEVPEVHIELIADGVHVHPAMQRTVHVAAPGRVALVTDAMAAAAAADGDYRLGPIGVEVRDGVARTAEGAIAGSTLTMAEAVRRTVAAGLPLADAVAAATRVPATAVGLSDVGELRPGARADLVVLDEDADVVRVMHGGGWGTAC